MGQALDTIENRPPPRPDPQAEHTVEILAKAHLMLRPLKKKRPAKEPHQLNLFD